MSSFAIIQQSTAIHIVTDGAGYDQAGTLARVSSKVISLPASNCALVTRGSDWATLPLHLLLMLSPSLDAICDGLPEVLSGLMEQFDACAGPEFSPELRNFELTIAGWSDRAQAWVACIASTFEACDPNDPQGISYLDGYAPYFAYFAAPVCCAPPIDAQAVLGRVLASQADVDALDAERDGLAMHIAQRSTPMLFGDQPRYLVGGFAEITTVSAAGIERRIIHEWPDRIGEQITPDGALPHSELLQMLEMAKAA